MIHIAILGFGTVGSGVGEVIEKNGAHIAQKLKDDICLKYILNRKDLVGTEFADRVVHDFSIIENDPEIDVVVETIGGADAALDYTRRALQAGKSVVTSNKELVAMHGQELLQLAKAKHVSYLFEASVGGGIPILRPLTQCLAANEIMEIAGILNGTTNYILTRMIRAGLSFDDALKEAQELGYAEKDPTADIEGIDACRKICILSSLAFGRHIYPDQVPTQGITKITLADVDYAQSGHMKIKLLGHALRDMDTNKVCAYVAPHLVSDDNPLSNVEDVYNAIMVRGDATGEVLFYGRGAGKLPTASAVVADVIDAAKHLKTRKYLDWAEGGPDTVYSLDTVASRWYLRGRTAGGILDLAAETTPLYRADAPEGEMAFLTDQAFTQPELTAILSDAGFVPDSVIRVLD